MKKVLFIRQIDNQKGVTAVVVAISLLVLIGFVALAVDLGYLYIVKGELQNAADSGALAGAQVLYINEGKEINPNADNAALSFVNANYSEKAQVEVQSIERGHWSFATKTFTPNNSLLPVDLWNATTAELDANVDFINAVRVITKRKTVGGSPAAPFFAGIWGINGPNITAVAVAYIGFAGTLKPGEADQPIAICLQSVMDTNGHYTCNMGRMSNSGSDGSTHNTSAWTNFTQPCQTATPNSVKELICKGGNPAPVVFGQGIGATGGEEANVNDALRNCFGPTTRTEPMNMTLPVIDCPGNNPSTCSKVVGAVNVDVVWVSDNDVDSSATPDVIEKKFEAENFPPSKMGDWTCPATCSTRLCCWDNFVSHFNLKNVDNASATYARRSIYFVPNCTPHKPSGTTGGANTGILAEIPVLVK